MNRLSSLFNLFRPFVTLLILPLVLSSCASVSIKETRCSNAAPKELPERIYVKKFTAPEQSFHVSSKGNDLRKLIEKERLSLANALITRLTKYIAPAVLLGDEEEPPTGNYWIITGSFNLVDEGNLLFRACIGFGLGKTEMKTFVNVHDLSGEPTDPFVTIETTGGSGKMPGAASAFIPITGVFVLSNSLVNAGGSVGGALGSGISSDSNRTAREIVAALSEYAASNKLISPNKALHPKKAGKISYL